MKDEMLVRLRRPDGKETLMRIEGEHLQRVMDLANGEFGDKSIDLGGPELPKEPSEDKNHKADILEIRNPRHRQ
jgi:hypothetical protein